MPSFTLYHFGQARLAVMTGKLGGWGSLPTRAFCTLPHQKIHIFEKSGGRKKLWLLHDCKRKSRSSGNKQKIPHSHITVCRHKSYRVKLPQITCDVKSPPISDPDGDYNSL